MDDILGQKTEPYSLDDLMDREGKRASEWSSSWIRAQRAILSPEQYDAEEIIARESHFVQKIPESNDLASKDAILALGLSASIPLLSRSEYAHFDKERNAQKYYSGLTPFDYFTFSLDGLLKDTPDNPAGNPADIALHHKAVAWGKMRLNNIERSGSSPEEQINEKTRLVEDLFLFCYFSTVLVSYNTCYPPGSVEPETGEPLEVVIDLDFMSTLCATVSRDLNVEIPVDGHALAQKIIPTSGAIMGMEAQTGNIINQVKTASDLLVSMYQARRKNGQIVIDEKQLPEVMDTLRASDWLLVSLAKESYNYLLSIRARNNGTKSLRNDTGYRRSIHQLKECVKLADSVAVLRDLQDLLMILGASGYEKMAFPIFQELAKKVENRREFMDELCEHRARNQEYSSLGWNVVKEGASKLDWQYKLILSNPPLATRLIEMIENPQVGSFYTACRLAALLAVKYPETVFASFLFSRLFPDTEAFLDPVRGSALRYMLEAIEDGQQRQNFYTSIISRIKGTIPRSVEMQERFVKMMQIYALVLGSQINVTTGSALDDRQVVLDVPDLEELPERDVEALKEYILQNRSIHISQDGNRLGKTGVDSPFEEVIAETKLSRNKESKKCPLSLACNISMRMKSGGTMYLRMTKDNNLLFRIMQNNITKEERLIEDGTDDWSVSAKTANELKYFVLCKLRDVYVRRRPGLPSTSQNDGASDIVGGDGGTDVILNEINSPDSDQTEPEESHDPELSVAEPETCSDSQSPDTEPDETPAPASDPLTPLREEHDQILDITDRAIGEMQIFPLSRDQQEEETRALNATQKIANNLEKAYRLLSPLREGKTLSAILPDDLSDLITYEKVKIEGEDYYEAVPFTQIYPRLITGDLSIDDVFVRTVRAFTQSLPYIKRYKTTPLTEAEALRQRDFYEEEGPVRRDQPRQLRLTVKRKRPCDDKVRLKMMLLTESGEGFGMNLEAKNKVLIFEADNTPANRAVFDMMRQRTDLEIRHETSVRVRNALDKNIKTARKKLVPPQLVGEEWQKADAHFRRVEDRMQRLAGFRAEQDALREIELRNRMQETASGGPATALHLPQVFPFAQTFNQGQFASLGDLLFARKKSNGKKTK